VTTSTRNAALSAPLFSVSPGAPGCSPEHAANIECARRPKRRLVVSAREEVSAILAQPMGVHHPISRSVDKDTLLPEQQGTLGLRPT
jgi:hypothetical protein